MRNTKELLQMLVSKSKDRGLKLTPQRMVIFRILSDSDEHLTVDDVYQRAKKEYPMLSPATVYRNMEQMVDAELLTSLDLGGTAMRYDTNLENHHHFICDKCGNVTDIYLDEFNYTVDEDRSSLGQSEINDSTLYLHGICTECK